MNTLYYILDERDHDVLYCNQLILDESYFNTIILGNDPIINVNELYYYRSNEPVFIKTFNEYLSYYIRYKYKVLKKTEISDSVFYGLFSRDEDTRNMYKEILKDKLWTPIFEHEIISLES